jgi:hypothetical protein
VIICTPQFAFGVPTVVKNALDPTVSSGKCTNKPVPVITVSTGSDKAPASFVINLESFVIHDDSWRKPADNFCPHQNK